MNKTVPHIPYVILTLPPKPTNSPAASAAAAVAQRTDMIPVSVPYDLTDRTTYVPPPGTYCTLPAAQTASPSSPGCAAQPKHPSPQKGLYFLDKTNPSVPWQCNPSSHVISTPRSHQPAVSELPKSPFVYTNRCLHGTYAAHLLTGKMWDGATNIHTVIPLPPAAPECLTQPWRL